MQATVKINSSQIYTLFAMAGIKDKEMQRHIISSFTDQRTDRTSQMTYQESQELIRWLKENNPEDKMRKKIIFQAHLLGWKLDNGKIDLARLDAWCLKYGIFHKELNLHTYSELVQLVSQFENAFKSYLKNL